jgi:hypothetical protein
MGRHTLATFLLRALNLLRAVTVTAEGLGDILESAQPVHFVIDAGCISYRGGLTANGLKLEVMGSEAWVQAVVAYMLHNFFIPLLANLPAATTSATVHAAAEK